MQLKVSKFIENAVCLYQNFQNSTLLDAKVNVELNPYTQ